MAKASFSAYLFGKKIASNWGKSAHFSTPPPPKKSTTNFGRPFSPSLFPFFCLKKWPKLCCFAFQNCKKVGRKRGLCQIYLFLFLPSHLSHLSHISLSLSLTPLSLSATGRPPLGVAFLALLFVGPLAADGACPGSFKGTPPEDKDCGGRVPPMERERERLRGNTIRGEVRGFQRLFKGPLRDPLRVPFSSQSCRSCCP